MRVSTTSTITCPRCHVPVGGDFKYCPECAFRLRPDPSAAGEGGVQSRRGSLLLVLAGAALLAAGVFVGRRIHQSPPVYEIVTPPRPHLRVADIQDHLVPIPSGVAEWRLKMVWSAPPDAEVPTRFLRTWGNMGPNRLREAIFQDSLLSNPLPLSSWRRVLSLVYEHSEDLVEELERHVSVETDRIQMMRYEVTRGQWGEFLEAVQRNPSLISNIQFVQDLWRPKEESLREYARGYWEHWWLAVERRYKARVRPRPVPGAEGAPASGEAPSPGAGARPLEQAAAVPPRPVWLSPDAPLLSDRHGVLLLIPPDWVRMDGAGNISWSIEENTEDLPVTGVSWWDVKMFIVWAKRSLRVTNLSLPNRGEWMRAFHGGNARRPPDDFDDEGHEGFKWPWGRDVDHDGCNNIHWGSDDEPPRLHSVRRTYGIHKGRTVEGVLNMAGNAAEWTDNYVASTRKKDGSGQLYATTWDYAEIRNEDEEKRWLPLAAAYGGSYLSGLDECQAESFVALDKRARQIDVGFRLILKKAGFGR